MDSRELKQEIKFGKTLTLPMILQCHKCGKSPVSRILPCCHTICKQCLTTDSNTSPRQCPLCQKETFTSGESEEYVKSMNNCFETITNVLGKRLLGDQTVNCCICRLRNVVSPATHQCLDCGDTLCNSCRLGHQSSSATHAHQVVDLNEIRNGKYKVKVQQNFHCDISEHKGKKYEFYCDTCSKLLCALCLVLKHMDHDVTSIHEKSVVMRSQLEALSQNMERKLSESVTSTIEILDRHRKSINKTQETTLSAVRDKTRQLIDLILEQEKSLMDQVVKRCDRQRADISMQENKLKQTQLGMKSVELLKCVLDEGSDEEIIMLFGNMKKVLDSNYISTATQTALSFALNLKYADFTIEHNFPELGSEMFNLVETFLDNTVALTETSNVNKVRPNVSGADTKPTKKTLSSPLVNTTSFVKLEQKPGTQTERNGTASLDSTDDQTLSGAKRRSQSSLTAKREGNMISKTELAEHPCNNLPTGKERQKEGVIKITESLSIVGDFARSISLNDSTITEVSKTEDDGASQMSSASSAQNNDVLPDIIPGPLDCKVHTPKDVSRFAVHGNLCGVKSKSLSDLSVMTKGLTKNPKFKSLCLVKEGSLSFRVSKDTSDAIIVGLCRYSDNRVVVLDEGNKKVRLINVNGLQDSVNHPNILTASLVSHGVATCDKKNIYLSGTTIHIADGILHLIKKIKLDIPDRREETVALPLCQHTNTSFLIGNLPGNMQRVYSIDGTVLEEKPCPVKAPVTAVSYTRDGHLLYSSWNQPGAVYQIRTTGLKVQTYRPPDVDAWYPEGTCVDMENNVYVANPRQNQIHVFRPNGSQFYVHSSADLASPRYLAMMSNSTLLVSGDSPELHTYKCTYDMKS